ncbi:hypothetical protein J2T13_001283 [Paenibacillus sp. DS2015]
MILSRGNLTLWWLISDQTTGELFFHQSGTMK